MSLRPKRRWALSAAALATASAIVLGGCSSGGKSILITSDMSPRGMLYMTHYVDDANPSDTSETNISTTSGMNGNSPMPMTVTFGKGANLRTELAQVTDVDGKQINVLAMSKENIGFGLLRSLTASVAQYQLRDIKGGLACGVKVELDFQPSFLQLFSTGGQGWDALWYYSVPCTATTLDIANAKLIGVNVSQQTVLRLTGDPIFFNRGRSVTIVGGPAAALTPGWWETNALPNSNASILGAANMVKQMVQDLNASPNPWMEFSPTGRFASSQLVYSAGDADVYNLRRFILNRQSNYVVNFRADPSQPWRRIIIRPVYNAVWNDWASRFTEISQFGGFDPRHVKDRLDANGFPKDPRDPVLKEIEINGCQNCQNAELSQVQYVDGNSGRVLYAITIRGYLGASSSLMMFGKMPPSFSGLQQRAENARKQQGMTSCPVKYNQIGQDATPVDSCAELLREGAMWDLITKDPRNFGFDMVAQMQVRDNSSYHDSCTGSGNDRSCTPVADNRRLDASYLFDTSNATQAWDEEQRLGPVGIDTLGFDYVYGPGTGDGMNFAMAQSVIRNQYLHGITDPALVFALDGPVPLPSVLVPAIQGQQPNNN